MSRCHGVVRSLVYLLLAGVLAGVLAACSAQRATHTVEVRHAGAVSGEVEQRAPVDLAGFLAAFRTFDWAAQAGRSGDGAEPSLKVSNNATGRAFFVSVVGDADYFSYVVGAIYPREMSRSAADDSDSGQAPVEVTETVRWAEVVVVRPAALVERYAQKYFAGDLDVLLEAMRKAPPFLDVPASELPHIGE